MFEADLLKYLGRIAGIGGISLGVFLILFREVIRKKIFPSLDKDAAYRLLRMVLLLTWTMALVGIIAWLFISYNNNTKAEKPAEALPSNSNSVTLGVPDSRIRFATVSHIVIKGNADDYELGWYKGIVRLTGYFVIHENVEMHQGQVFLLKAVPAGDVLLKYQGPGEEQKQLKLAKFEKDIENEDSLTKLNDFLYKKRGQLVFIKSELSIAYARLFDEP